MTNEEQSGGNKRREITISLGPLKLTLRGYDVLLTLICCGLVGIGVFVYLTSQAVADEHKTIVAHQTRQEEIMSEMIYVLTLTADRREQLQLDMPETLRKKVRDAHAR